VQASAKAGQVAPSELKRRLRAEASARRKRAAEETGWVAAKSLAARAAQLAGAAPNTSFAAGYSPVRDEIDPAPLLHALEQLGLRICLPLTGSGLVLTFRHWTPGSPLKPGRYGIGEPDVCPPEAVPSLVLVPLLAFDTKGNRLGYGAGYYDATLRALRRDGAVTAIGLGFDEQQYPDIPREPQDEPLNMILTPSRLFACGG
jgi:5-formyltetrahydrofolate cyclo-ligase